MVAMLSTSYGKSAAQYVQNLQRLRAERGTLDAHWQEIADLMAPNEADFTVTRSMGEKRAQKIYDSTPGTAGANLASGLYGLISSPANDWFELKHQDDEINDIDEVRDWLSDVARRMRNQLASNGGRFYSKIFPLYKSLVYMGTGVFWMEEVPGKREIFYACRSLAESYIVENAYEQVDTVYRVWKWTGRQAIDYFEPRGYQLPEAIIKAAEKEPERTFEFLHVTEPNQAYKRGQLGRDGKRYASVWISIEGPRLLGQGGFARFNYQVPRWSPASVGPYGNSPAMLALPDVKMLNALAKVNLIGMQQVVAPPILAMDETASGFSANPGDLIYNGLDEVGNPRYKPMFSGARPDVGIEFEEKRRDAIREAFHHSLMLMVAKPGATATEVLAMQDEKLRLMGPHLGRIQAEFLDPMLDWVFATMLDRGAFPPIPEALLENPSINIDYVSPLARAQKTGEGAALIRAVDALAPLKETHPEIYDNIDADQFSRSIWDAFGANPKVLRDPKMVAQMREQRGQQQDMQSMLASAMPISGAIKNLAQAGGMMQQGGAQGGAPGGAPGGGMAQGGAAIVDRRDAGAAA